MASRESDNGAPAGQVNDSIDELLDGLPAEPMLPKKRARPIDQAAPPSSSPRDRRSGDKVIVSEGTDPRERARRERELAQRESSTFGTSFLQPNLNWQKAVVGVVVMLAVLGIYAFVRQMRKSATPPIDQAITQNMQNTSNSAAPIAAPSIATAIASDALPPVPPAATSDVKASTTMGATHHSQHAHNATGDHGAPVSSAPTSSANTRTDVSRSL